MVGVFIRILNDAKEKTTNTQRDTMITENAFPHIFRSFTLVFIAAVIAVLYINLHYFLLFIFHRIKYYSCVSIQTVQERRKANRAVVSSTNAK